MPEVDGGSSEDQYDDLYVFIPGDNPEINSQEPLGDNRPPLPPPRPVVAALQLDKSHLTLQGKFKVKVTIKKIDRLNSIEWSGKSIQRRSTSKPKNNFTPFFN